MVIQCTQSTYKPLNEFQKLNFQFKSHQISTINNIKKGRLFEMKVKNDDIGGKN